jgi:hypothetical protein
MFRTTSALAVLPAGCFVKFKMKHFQRCHVEPVKHIIPKLLIQQLLMVCVSINLASIMTSTMKRGDAVMALTLRLASQTTAPPAAVKMISIVAKGAGHCKESSGCSSGINV